MTRLEIPDEIAQWLSESPGREISLVSDHCGLKIVLAKYQDVMGRTARRFVDATIAWEALESAQFPILRYHLARLKVELDKADHRKPNLP